MKISDLIEALGEIMAEHGTEIEVCKMLGSQSLLPVQKPVYHGPREIETHNYYVDEPSKRITHTQAARVCL